jgi:hypothetical protein
VTASRPLWTLAAPAPLVWAKLVRAKLVRATLVPALLVPALLVPALLVLVLAGCGPAPSPTVATARRTADKDPAGPPATTPARSGDYDQALRYTRCMTDHGYPMADPVEGRALLPYNVSSVPVGSGSLVGTNGSGTAVIADTGPRYVAAHGACKQFMPDSWPVAMDPVEWARSAALYQCMKDEGVQVPEPGPDGMISMPTDPDLTSTPEYDEALRKCRHFYDDPANNDPANR